MGAHLQISPENIRRVVTEALPRPVESGVIFGDGGRLDSLDLVNFLADLEYGLEREFGRRVVLASERAMSWKRSPFRDVEALTGYIAELLAE